MSNLRRRDFIAIVSAGMGATYLGVGAIRSHGAIPLASAEDRRLRVFGQGTPTPTFCEMCFWKCAGWVTKNEKGELWKVTGNETDLHSFGRLCTRGTGGIGSYYDNDRLKRPMIRVGEVGSQEFKEVSWDEAFTFIAAKMKKVKELHGADKMVLFKHGIGGGFFKQLFHAYGSNMDTHPSYAQCRGARAEGFKLTFGEGVGSPERTDMENSQCIVLMGSHIGENLHNSQVQTFVEALNKGCDVITVDPRFSVAASKSKYWLPIKPGTDMALVLAWIHVLIEESLYDKEYIDTHAIGFEELAAEVKDKTPEWAFPITSIRPEIIRQTARLMAKNAPATLVHPSRHVAWYGDDTQRMRSIAILNALLGNWGEKGGFYFQRKAVIGKYPIPEYPHSDKNWYDLVDGKFPLASSAPSTVIRDLTIEDKFKVWFVYATNLMQSLPEQAKTLEAIKHLDLLVVIDTMPAEITGHADVILPECTYLERYDDLRITPGKKAQIAIRAPATKPKWDSKPAWWMAKELSNKLGIGEYFPWENIEELLEYRLQTVGLSLAELQKEGVIDLPDESPLYRQKDEVLQFATPSGKIELYSETLKEHGFDPIPKFTMPEQPPEGHYRLIYGRAPAHTFGKTTNNPLLYELMPENSVWVHSDVARTWGIENDDYVRLKNQDGVISLKIRVKVTERIRTDAVYMVHGFGRTSKHLSRAYGKGADDQQLITRVKVDPIMGSTGFRTNFVTFEV